MNKSSVKDLGYRLVESVLLSNREEISSVLTSFISKHQDSFFNLRGENLSKEKLSHEELLGEIENVSEIEAGGVLVEVWLDFEKVGIIRSLAPTAPYACWWLKTCDEEIRLNYHFEILGERGKNLGKDELKYLAEMIFKIETKNNFLCELSWGKIGNDWWLIDCKEIPGSIDDISTYVDSNLSENYSGVTSPLTFSLVKNLYPLVLREASKTMNFSTARLKHLESAFPNLINHVDWHLYYNIESYYTVLGNLPFGERSIEEWHQKIGGKVYHYESSKYILKYGKIEMLQTIWGMLRIIFKQEQVFTGLMTSLHEQKIAIKEDIERVNTPEEGWRLFEKLMNRPMGLGLVVINDLFIVVGLRLLTEILLKKGYKESDLPLLLKTDLELQAIRPLEALNHLKRRLTQKSWDILVQESVNENWKEPYNPIYQKLRDSGEGNFARELEQFITLHGERSFEEFKLESLGLSQNPKLLVKLLDSFYGDKNPYLGISSKPVAIVLNPWQKWVLQFTRRSLDWREAARFKRVEIYHLFRKLVIKTASLIRKNESNFNQFDLRDFFSLTLDEWLSWSQKELSSQDVISIMGQRESWKLLEKSYPELYFQNKEDTFHHIPIKRDKASVVRGIGASPGEVTGKALVLQHPEEAFMIKDLEERILITKNTDPAWVYIMVRAKGLVSEKGSVLGHAAIIGRELKLTTIVSAPNITDQVKTGDLITINGTSGEVFIHSN